MQAYTRDASRWVTLALALTGGIPLVGSSCASEGPEAHRTERGQARSPLSPRAQAAAELGSREQQEQLVRMFQGIYHRVRGKVPYVEPRAEEKTAFLTLVNALLDVASSGRLEGLADLQHAAALQRLWVERVVLGPLQFLALSEAPGAARGWGAWIVRVGPAPGEVILQAPHTFFDMGTGPLALEAFARLPFRALGFNTVHRGSKAGGEGAEPSLTDVAHNDTHPFHLMTLAMARLSPLAVIQLHGFKMDVETGSATLILSDGSRERVSPLRDALGESLARAVDGVRVFPRDIQAMGGTLNVQGKAVRTWEGSSFLHLELSGPLREKLQSDAALRAQFLDALAQPLFRR